MSNYNSEEFLDFSFKKVASRDCFGRFTPSQGQKEKLPRNDKLVNWRIYIWI